MKFNIHKRVQQCVRFAPVALPSIRPPGPRFDNASDALGTIVGGAFQLIMIVGGLYAIITIIIAGYNMIASGGDKTNLGNARSKIIWSIVGLIVIAISWGLIVLVQQMLGICFGLNFGGETCSVEF